MENIGVLYKAQSIIKVRQQVRHFQNKILVGISEYAFGESPEIIQTTLGSCVAICLYDSNNRVGSLAHALLPSFKKGARKSRQNPLKFVDTLIDLQLKEFKKKKIHTKFLQAKIFGGANMFPEIFNNYSKHVGLKNVEMAIKKLMEVRIPIIETNIGDTFGRKIEFYLQNGFVKVFKIEKID